MYKRKARLLFASKEPALLASAEEQVQLLAADWLESETELLEGPISKPWFVSAEVDLVILLYIGGEDYLPADYQGSIPYREWHVSRSTIELERDLSREIKSMVAGMQMLARMDS